MIRKSLALLAAVVICAVLVARPAGAQTYGQPTAFILTPSTITPGGEVTAIGFGCAKGQVVQISINGQTVATTIAQNDDRGSFQATFTAPSTPGQHIVTAQCGSVIMTSALTVIAAPVAISATLPPTGSASTLPLTKIALALVATGGLVLLAARRRRNPSSA